MAKASRRARREFNKRHREESMQERKERRGKKVDKFKTLDATNKVLRAQGLEELELDEMDLEEPSAGNWDKYKEMYRSNGEMLIVNARNIKAFVTADVGGPDGVFIP